MTKVHVIRPRWYLSPVHLRAARGDLGSAVVEFALIAPLVALVAVALLHLALASYVRTTVVSAAAEGARAAAMAGASAEVGESRTRALLERSLPLALVDGVEASVAAVDGLATMQVRVEAHIPALSVLGQGEIVGIGHAVIETWA